MTERSSLGSTIVVDDVAVAAWTIFSKAGTLTLLMVPIRSGEVVVEFCLIKDY